MVKGLHHSLKPSYSGKDNRKAREISKERIWTTWGKVSSRKYTSKKFTSAKQKETGIEKDKGEGSHNSVKSSN